MLHMYPFINRSRLYKIVQMVWELTWLLAV